MKKVLSGIVLCLVFVASHNAFACIHAKRGKTKFIDQHSFKVALAHANGTQTIVIQPKIGVKEKTDIGWVFPVPEVPSNMSVANTSFLIDMTSHFFPNHGPKMKSLSLGMKGGKKKRSKEVIVHKTINTGPFSITPIEGGYKGVANWLKKNDYTKIPKSHLKAYLDKGWVILAAKIDVDAIPSDGGAVNIIPLGDVGVKGEPKKKKKKIAKKFSHADLPPILIQFKSEKLVFPWMFERTNKRTPFRFIVFSEQEITAKAVNKLKKRHSIDSPFFKKGKTFSPKDLPEGIYRSFSKFGFPIDADVHVLQITSNAASHKTAAKKRAPDLSIALK